MNTLAILLVLASAVMHALRNFFTKTSFDKQVFIWMYHLVTLLVFLPFFIYFLVTTDVLSWTGFWLVLVSGGIHFFYWLALSKSYEEGDLSHVYPIMRSSPALVLLFAVLFLNESVTLFGVLGILMITLGVYSINLKSLTLKGFLEPILSASKDAHVRYAFLTLLLVAVYSVVDGFAVDHLHPIVFLYGVTIVSMAVLTPYIFSKKTKASMVKEWIHHKAKMILNGILTFAGYALILIAFTFTQISYVVGFRQLSIVFAVLLGSHVLKEEYKLIRFFAATLIFLGAFLVATA